MGMRNLGRCLAEAARVIDRVARLQVPGVQVFTPYGATEALPVASIGSEEILGETRYETERSQGVCVGRPVPGVRVAVIPISDAPIPSWQEALALPPGQVGEIIVQGPQVTPAYYSRPGATALAKIPDPATGSFYHRMGDVGYFDEQGRLWFCGRKSQRVETPAGTFFTIPCEAVFNTHPQVQRTALVGVSRNGTTEPVLCVQLWSEYTAGSRETLKRELLALGAKHPRTQAIKTILFKKVFPVDIRHNAKIFREKLAAWAARRLR
jgi:acyl-CoA synthetase (AMP-forming)/AMP-acid ligase II